MKKGIIGKKVGMTQIFDETGLSIPVTVIEAGPCIVVQKKTVENDGYSSVMVGFSTDVAERNVNKPVKGQFEKAKIPLMKHLRELRLDDAAGMSVGDEIKADVFAAGDKVDVTGISKGKGFQGTIKRYGQSGGNETHGSMYHRRVGSMGSSSSPSRVFKGKRLPGHMGVDRVTVQNLEVVRVDAERNFILIKGAVPGPKKALLILKDTVKKNI